MAKRTFRGRGISESQRRKKTWITVKTPVAAAAGNSLFLTVINMFTTDTAASAGAFTEQVIALIDDPIAGVGDESSSLPEECTILRARGSLNFPKNEIFAGQLTVDTNHVFGIGVTDIRSLVSGSAPLPVTDSDWDGWMFLRQSSVSPVDSEGTIVDIKSMRKIKNGDALFMAVQTVAGSAAVATGGNWTFDLRLLVLLP